MLLDERIYTVPEAADLTHLSTWCLWDLLKKRRIMRTKVAGRTFIRESELRKLVVDNPAPRGNGKKAKKATDRNTAPAR
jgi:hypothetical protein